MSVVGTLTHLNGGQVYIDSTVLPAGASSGLPWYLEPLRVEGYLGQVHARYLGVQEMLQTEPSSWSLEQTLYSALELSEAPGAITLGLARIKGMGLPNTLVMANEAQLVGTYDHMAGNIGRFGIRGSAVGGQKPKFILEWDGQHRLVKFSPPVAQPYGKRWRDLLHAEHLALSILARNGVQTAHSRILASTERVYLETERFDRAGSVGRRHVVSLGCAHHAFSPKPIGGWKMKALALAKAGRLSESDAVRVELLWHFGRLIGNTDMHDGNLALFVERADVRPGRFTLAPVYDMLPMQWAPKPPAELWGYELYDSPDDSLKYAEAVGLATQFWGELAALDGVSQAMRDAADVMYERLRIVAAAGS